MSLESALDDERRAIMELLEGRKQTRSTSRSTAGGRAASPAAAQSPVRSMLDIAGGAGPAAARHASIAGQGAGITSMPRAPSTSKSPPPNYRSMLDTDPPPPSAPPTMLRGPRSNASPPPSARSLAAGWGARGNNPEQAYNFEMLPSIESHAMPKRVTQGGKKKKEQDAETNPKSPLTPRDGTRAGAMASVLGKNPMSPARLGRSVSPGSGHLPKPNSLNLMADPNKFQLDSGKMMDMSSAYRRLSDAALLRSGGSLAGLGKRKPSDSAKGDEIISPRLEKDYLDEEALESSDAEDTDTSSDDGWASERRRGRTTRRKDAGSGNDDSNERKPKSLLAAAEDERKTVSGSYRVRSLLGSEPTVTVTGPDGEKTMQKKSGVHPNTSFDTGQSGVNTPVDSDAEENLSDIRRAQRLAMSIGPITTSSEACRCVRMIVRGEYSALQREAELGLRRQRVYLVATDLSEEAAYALEWTIGTVLRDGDTMLAVYAVDDETGTGAAAAEMPGTPGLPKASNSGLEIGQGSVEAETLVKTLSHDGTQLNPRMQSMNAVTGSRPSSPAPNGFGKALENGELDLASMSKPERESYLATKEVGERCVKLLRKTKLQVRVVVEVFRSKSPRHTLTEVIDYLDPTLVILGSRGRSALKGVLLGSFSNYLVTKSSVPVMVARKKLRKASKYKRSNMRFSNVLTNPTSKLANAKID